MTTVDRDLMRRMRKMRQRLVSAEAKSPMIYVEDTYTPTYLGATTAGTTTYSVQQGWYWRMGSLLYVTGLVVWTAATGTGNAVISLPFAPSSTIGFRASGSLRVTTVTFANSSPQLLLDPSAARFTMDSPLTNAAGTTVAVEAAGNVTFSLFYGVD